MTRVGCTPTRGQGNGDEAVTRRASVSESAPERPGGPDEKPRRRWFGAGCGPAVQNRQAYTRLTFQSQSSLPAMRVSMILLISTPSETGRAGVPSERVEAT